MTQRREMGNAARNAIDEAAEEVNSANTEVESMVLCDSIQDTPQLMRLTRVAIKLNRALRWLESIGAKTHP